MLMTHWKIIMKEATPTQLQYKNKMKVCIFIL